MTTTTTRISRARASFRMRGVQAGMSSSSASSSSSSTSFMLRRAGKAQGRWVPPYLEVVRHLLRGVCSTSSGGRS
eukprot:9203625-Pyramimonas_sp.AAC.1